MMVLASRGGNTYICNKCGLKIIYLENTYYDEVIGYWYKYYNSDWSRITDDSLSCEEELIKRIIE
jgi:hypothetical protein